MSKRSQASGHTLSRVWIALVVVAALAAVLGLKLLGGAGESPTQAAGPTASARTAPAQVAPTLTEPPGAAAVQSEKPLPPTADPFPSEPLAQIAWVQRNQKPAMILFHSTSCIPCKKMEALVAEVHDDYEPDVYFIDVITNDKANAALVRQANIQAIPTTFFVSRGGQGKRNVGAMQEDALRAQLDLLRQGGL